MGGSVSGNFGNTKGNSLDALSNLLATASLIPGLDTFTNLASIPVDLARGDFLSAGLSAIGAIPVVGEVADTTKLAKMAGKAVDAIKVADKVSDVGKTIVKIPKLPKTPTKLKGSGWKETTSAAMKKNTTSRMFKKDGLTIRFDKGKKGIGGYGGKDHYHVLNPKGKSNSEVKTMLRSTTIAISHILFILNESDL